MFSIPGESALMDHLMIELSELETEEDASLNINEENGLCPKMAAV